METDGDAERDAEEEEGETSAELGSETDDEDLPLPPLETGDGNEVLHTMF